MPQFAFLLRAYAFLGALAASAHSATTLSAGALVSIAIVLAAAPTLSVWYQSLVRCSLTLHQFEPGRGIHWVASRLTLRKVMGALAAIGLALSAILHSSFLTATDWAVVAMMPIVFVLIRAGVSRVLYGQVRAPVYALRATLVLTGWTTAILATAAWILVASGLPVAPSGGLLDHVWKLQKPWSDAASVLAQSAADALAWGVAASDYVSSSAQDLRVRAAVLMVLAPLATLAFVVLGLQGLALPAVECRRALMSSLALHEPPPSPSVGDVAVRVAVGVLSLVVLLNLTAYAEQASKAIDRPFAAKLIPKCEAIDGKVYKVGTLEVIRQLLTRSTAEVAQVRERTCSSLAVGQSSLERAVDSYLDWYFSLPAEWSRILSMLGGDLEKLLSDKLTEAMASAPGFAEALARVQDGSRAQADALDTLKVDVRRVLADNVLVLSEASCKVIHQGSFAHALAASEEKAAQLRVAGSAGAGLTAGVLASKVAAKAMTKGSMKLATKVLAKFVAKKAAVVSLTSSFGAALGSVVPVLGTVTGGFLGALTGLAISLAVDWAALAAEERLERDTMKAELVGSIRETVATSRRELGCDS